jgi:hypothetical protein
MLQTLSVFAAVDYNRTLILAIELSSKNWVLAAQVPGLPKSKASWQHRCRSRPRARGRLTPRFYPYSALHIDCTADSAARMLIELAMTSKPQATALQCAGANQANDVPLGLTRTRQGRDDP